MSDNSDDEILSKSMLSIFGHDEEQLKVIREVYRRKYEEHGVIPTHLRKKKEQRQNKDKKSPLPPNMNSFTRNSSRRDYVKPSSIERKKTGLKQRYNSPLLTPAKNSNDKRNTYVPSSHSKNRTNLKSNTKKKRSRSKFRSKGSVGANEQKRQTSDRYEKHSSSNHKPLHSPFQRDNPSNRIEQQRQQHQNTFQSDGIVSSMDSIASADASTVSSGNHSPEKDGEIKFNPTLSALARSEEILKRSPPPKYLYPSPSQSQPRSKTPLKKGRSGSVKRKTPLSNDSKSVYSRSSSVRSSVKKKRRHSVSRTPKRTPTRTHTPIRNTPSRTPSKRSKSDSRNGSSSKKVKTPRSVSGRNKFKGMGSYERESGMPSSSKRRAFLKKHISPQNDPKFMDRIELEVEEAKKRLLKRQKEQELQQQQEHEEAKSNNLTPLSSHSHSTHHRYSSSINTGNTNTGVMARMQAWQELRTPKQSAIINKFSPLNLSENNVTTPEKIPLQNISSPPQQQPSRSKNSNINPTQNRAIVMSPFPTYQYQDSPIDDAISEREIPLGKLEVENDVATARSKGPIEVSPDYLNKYLPLEEDSSLAGPEPESMKGDNNGSYVAEWDVRDIPSVGSPETPGSVSYGNIYQFQQSANGRSRSQLHVHQQKLIPSPINNNENNNIHSEYEDNEGFEPSTYLKYSSSLKQSSPSSLAPSSKIVRKLNINELEEFLRVNGMALDDHVILKSDSEVEESIRVSSSPTASSKTNFKISKALQSSSSSSSSRYQPSQSSTSSSKDIGSTTLTPQLPKQNKSTNYLQHLRHFQSSQMHMRDFDSPCSAGQFGSSPNTIGGASLNPGVSPIEKNPKLGSSNVGMGTSKLGSSGLSYNASPLGSSVKFDKNDQTVNSSQASSNPPLASSTMGNSLLHQTHQQSIPQPSTASFANPPLELSQVSNQGSFMKARHSSHSTKSSELNPPMEMSVINDLSKVGSSCVNEEVINEPSMNDYHRRSYNSYGSNVPPMELSDSCIYARSSTHGHNSMSQVSHSSSTKFKSPTTNKTQDFQSTSSSSANMQDSHSIIDRRSRNPIMNTSSYSPSLGGQNGRNNDFGNPTLATIDHLHQRDNNAQSYNNNNYEDNDNNSNNNSSSNHSFKKRSNITNTSNGPSFNSNNNNNHNSNGSFDNHHTYGNNNNNSNINKNTHHHHYDSNPINTSITHSPTISHQTPEDNTHTVQFITTFSPTSSNNLANDDERNGVNTIVGTYQRSSGEGINPINASYYQTNDNNNSNNNNDFERNSNNINDIRDNGEEFHRRNNGNPLSSSVLGSNDQSFNSNDNNTSNTSNIQGNSPQEMLEQQHEELPKKRVKVRRSLPSSKYSLIPRPPMSTPPVLRERERNSDSHDNQDISNFPQDVDQQINSPSLPSHCQKSEEDDNPMKSPILEVPNNSLNGNGGRVPVPPSHPPINMIKPQSTFQSREELIAYMNAIADAREGKVLQRTTNSIPQPPSSNNPQLPSQMSIPTNKTKAFIPPPPKGTPPKFAELSNQNRSKPVSQAQLVGNPVPSLEGHFGSGQRRIPGGADGNPIIINEEYSGENDDDNREGEEQKEEVDNDNEENKKIEPIHKGSPIQFGSYNINRKRDIHTINNDNNNDDNNKNSKSNTTQKQTVAENNVPSSAVSISTVDNSMAFSSSYVSSSNSSSSMMSSNKISKPSDLKNMSEARLRRKAAFGDTNAAQILARRRANQAARYNKQKVSKAEKEEQERLKRLQASRKERQVLPSRALKPSSKPEKKIKTHNPLRECTKTENDIKAKLVQPKILTPEEQEIERKKATMKANKRIRENSQKFKEQIMREELEKKAKKEQLFKKRDQRLAKFRIKRGDVMESNSEMRKETHPSLISQLPQPGFSLKQPSESVNSGFNETQNVLQQQQQQQQNQSDNNHNLISSNNNNTPTKPPVMANAGNKLNLLKMKRRGGRRGRPVMTNASSVPSSDQPRVKNNPALDESAVMNRQKAVEAAAQNQHERDLFKQIENEVKKSGSASTNTVSDYEIQQAMSPTLKKENNADGYENLTEVERELLMGIDLDCGF